MAATACTWPGKSSRVRWLLWILLVLSAVSWILGIVWTIQVSNTPVKEGSTALSTAILYLYSNAVPMASTLASAIEILLFQLGYLSPIASIIWSIIAIGAWLYSFMTWMVCEMADYGCVIPLYRFQYEYGPLERPTGTGPGLWECRLIFTMAVVAGYFVYLGFAGRAIDVQRKEEKMRRAVMAKEWVELGEGGRKV